MSVGIYVQLYINSRIADCRNTCLAIARLCFRVLKYEKGYLLDFSMLLMHKYECKYGLEF